MANNSVTLHRVLKATPEKVYRAFIEPNAMSFWLPPYGFLCVVHQMDVRAGGSYKMSFTNFSTGNGHSFGGNFLEIKPNEFIKYTDKFDDPNMPGEITTSIWLKKVLVGTGNMSNGIEIFCPFLSKGRNEKSFLFFCQSSAS